MVVLDSPFVVEVGPSGTIWRVVLQSTATLLSRFVAIRLAIPPSVFRHAIPPPCYIPIAAAVTVSCVVPDTESKVAVIVDVPGLTPVARTLESTALLESVA